MPDDSIDHHDYPAKIKDNLEAVRHSIEDAVTDTTFAAAQKNITLIAVSKKKPLTAIQAAYAAGQRDFGENYVQEAVDKIVRLNSASPQNAAIWHFIGHLQSNKSQEVAQHFAWVHTIDRLKIAKHLSRHRATNQPPLNVCVQVNIDQGTNKNGVLPQEAEALCQAITALPQLKLRGLMAIPEPDNPEAFPAMRALYDTLQMPFKLDILSMGMSNDYLAAIQQGADCVRIGTAIFGAR